MTLIDWPIAWLLKITTVAQAHNMLLPLLVYLAIVIVASARLCWLLWRANRAAWAEVFAAFARNTPIIAARRV